MYNKKTANIFKSNVQCQSNGSDAFYGKNIPGGVKNEVRNKFGINSSQEEILLVRDTSFWNTRDQGLVVTDWGVYCITDNDDADSKFQFSWECVEKVWYQDEAIYFKGYDNNEWHIHASYFFKDKYYWAQKLAQAFQKMADSQQWVDANAILQDFIVKGEDDSIAIEKKEDRAKELIDSDTFNANGIALIYGVLGKAWWLEGMQTYNEKGRYSNLNEKDKERKRKECWNNAIDYAKLSLSNVDDEYKKNIYAEVRYYQAYAERELGNQLGCVRMAIEALPFAQNDKEKTDLISLISAKANLSPKAVLRFRPSSGYGIYGESIEEYRKIFEEDHARDIADLEECEGEVRKELEKVLEEDLQNNLKMMDSGQEFFSHRPYQERQFIFIVRDLDSIGGCYDETDNIKYVFPIDEVPHDIGFPLGHPQANTLYYAHPLRPYYIPLKDANLTLFNEKISEMSRLFQCLGATSISLRCLKGKNVKENNELMRTIDGSVDNRIASVSANVNMNRRNEISTSRRDEMSEVKNFNPTQAPYVPDDLLWAACDPDINSLVKQRLQGGLLDFSKKVSSFETMSVSENTMLDVQGAFNYMMVKVSSHYNAKADRTFSETSETEWEMSVEFKPLSQFNVTQEAMTQEMPRLTRDEEEYIEEYQACIEEDGGMISDRSRRQLDRFANRLGLPAARVNELEKLLAAPKLSEDEKEYLEIVKECFEDGEITDRERRLMKRYRERLGIDEERAAQIEKMILK